MKTIIALALSTVVLGATPAFADAGSSALCGPNGPEGYKRPGGYCERLDKNSSLVEPAAGPEHLPVVVVIKN